MSTKNLARTAIEGGREHGNCWYRRYTNRRQRPRTRDALTRATRETGFDDLVIASREPLWRMFRDKLSAPERWLDHQVGRRCLPPTRRWRPPVVEPLPRPERELAAWLDGRRVGARGEVLFWFTRPRAAAFASITVSMTTTSRSGAPFPAGSARATILMRRLAPAPHL